MDIDFAVFVLNNLATPHQSCCYNYISRLNWWHFYASQFPIKMHLHITMTLLQPWTTTGAAPVVSSAGVTPTSELIWYNVLSERKNCSLNTLRNCTLLVYSSGCFVRTQRMTSHIQAEAQSHCSRLCALMNRRFMATSTCNFIKAAWPWRKSLHHYMIENALNTMATHGPAVQHCDTLHRL